MSNSPAAPLDAEHAEARMRTIARLLGDAGLDTRMHEARGMYDVTAVPRQAPSPSAGSARCTQVIVDDDGYTELRYWNPATATPEEIVATISRALDATTAQC